jgi:FkbM family methyltransferase
MYSFVFFGFYESSEIRFIEKYLRPDLSVIELGGSAGIVSSHIVNRLESGRRYVIVELNPTLIETNNTNVVRHNRNNVNVMHVNKAISYNFSKISFDISGNNTETSVYSNRREYGQYEVETVKFNEIVDLLDETGYTLVSDIEGAELELLMEEHEVLKNCKQLFIELHTSEYKGERYSVEMIKQLLIDKHEFKLVDQHGPVCYLKR